MEFKSPGCLITGGITVFVSFAGILIPREFGSAIALPLRIFFLSIEYGAIGVPTLSAVSIALNNHILGYLFSLWLFAAGLGTMFVRNWGRVLSLVYVLVMLGSCIISGIVIIHGYIVYYYELNRQGGLSTLPVYFGLGSYLVSLIGTLIHPIFLLIFFSRPNIKKLFTS